MEQESPTDPKAYRRPEHLPVSGEVLGDQAEDDAS